MPNNAELGLVKIHFISVIRSIIRYFFMNVKCCGATRYPPHTLHGRAPRRLASELSIVIQFFVQRRAQVQEWS